MNYLLRKDLQTVIKLPLKNKGNVTPGKMPSDLVVSKELKHNSYTRKENDLLIKQITLDEALFGHSFYFYHPMEEHYTSNSTEI